VDVNREDANRSLVSGLADALNEHDLTRARSYVADDLRFIGVFGQMLEGADAYLDAMGRLGARQTLLKCFVEQDEVACFYELSLPAKPDVRLFSCGWFGISNEKINSIRVVFDPTPLGKN
jgi:ketosteroid isomerase-like protein